MSEAELKLARSLHHRKYRERHGAFLVQGHKMVAEALASSAVVRYVVATEEATAHFHVPTALLRIVPEQVLARIGTLETGNSIIAVVDQVRHEPMDAFGPDDLILAVDRVQDPGNLGTILRTADWFGLSQVWCSHGTVDAFNPKCVQASMGAILRVPVVNVDLQKCITTTLQRGCAIFLATADGPSVFDVELVRPAMLIMGNESQGPSEDLLDMPIQRVRVPGSGGAESLNVSMAATALCMEFERRREVG